MVNKEKFSNAISGIQDGAKAMPKFKETSTPLENPSVIAYVIISLFVLMLVLIAVVTVWTRL